MCDLLLAVIVDELIMIVIQYYSHVRQETKKGKRIAEPRSNGLAA